MESRAKVLGHAAHPMLIVVPLGMFVGAEVFDALFYFGGRDATWATVAYWMTVVGLIGGVVAAVPGWIDWFAIPKGTRAKAVGLVHGLGNGLGVLGLYGASWWLRKDDPHQPARPGVAPRGGRLRPRRGDGVAGRGVGRAAGHRRSPRCEPERAQLPVRAAGGTRIARVAAVAHPRSVTMSTKHHGGPAPVPPGNRPQSGPAHQAEDEHAADQSDTDTGAPFQEQDPQRRLGGYSGTGEHPIQQPTQLNDGQ